MKIYIENLIPRLKEFSQNLDKKEIFVDIPWVSINDENVKHKYIFKRNGELILSTNGEVIKGSWEYLSTSKNLLLDRISDKILLNQIFIHPAIMILKIDDFSNENLILANELLISDLNKIESYAKKLINKHNNVHEVMSTDGILYEIHKLSDKTDVGSRVTLGGKNIDNTIIQFKNKKAEIIDGKISRVLQDTKYISTNGELIIEQQFFGYVIGDRVFLNGNNAPDGVYKLGFMDYLYVVNGRVSDKKTYKRKR